MPLPEQGFRSSAALLFALLWLAIPASAAEPLTVGTKVAPPFAMQDAAGSWQGISIELMELVGQELNRDIVWQQQSLAQLISGVANGDLDASISALSITSDRERQIDFSHQYFGSGLTIVTPSIPQAGWKNALKALISPQFLATVLLLCGVLSFVGVIIWLLEAKRNQAQFGQSASRGIGSGFWFAAVTMTTVGYGDKAPITFAGRLVSVIWMFAALILTAFLTAQLTTILTAQQTENTVQSRADLPRARVGNLKDSASSRYFSENHIPVTGYSSVEAGLQAVANNELDAFVHDQPLLQWLVSTSNTPLQILPDLFDPQGYAIAVAQSSPLREQVNIALLKILAAPEWLEIRKRYLGNSIDH